ncbi:ATPase domain-containing protein [Haloferacaceae archaeon DSL9]
MGTQRRLSTGVAGLDDVLSGGLLPERAYMVRGRPGTGKTILGLQFLSEGCGYGDDALCIHFEESTDDIILNAERLGIDVSDVEFIDLSPGADVFSERRSYDIFAVDETEGPDITNAIVDAVTNHDPDRVLVDPVTQLRHFTADVYRFRKEVMSFVNYLTKSGATALFTSQPTADARDSDLQFMCDGTIGLDYSAKGRTVQVTKFRGSDYQSGEHTVRISSGGLSVYPILVPRDHIQAFSAEQISSGVNELDSLLHGGIERGAVSVFSGPSGVGKTTTGTAFMQEAAARGERSVVYLFEETADVFRHRCSSIGMPVPEMEAEGTLAVEEIEPVMISPDEFASKVRREVEQQDARIVMLDGISGYRLSIRGDESNLVRELHSLCRYLKNMGVTVILVDDVPTVTGDFEVTSTHISYLADNIVFLRYIEIDGELRKSIGVLKKRASDFERTLREFEITDGGLRVGEPLSGLRGILTGMPDSNASTTDD